MKPFCLALCGLVALVAFVGCKSESEKNQSVFEKEVGQAPSIGTTETYVTSCLPKDGVSFRLELNLTGSKRRQVVELRQTMYLHDDSCIGHPRDSDVQSEVLRPGGPVQAAFSGDLATITMADGTAVTASRVDSAEFRDGVGLFVEYKGAAASVGSVLPASLFSQIIGYSSYFGNYPFLWKYENGLETYPKQSPLVASDIFVSADYERLMKTCAADKMVIVGAGRFKTCLVTRGAEKIWYGNVPIFGVVKYEKPEGVMGTEAAFQQLLLQQGLPATAALEIELTSVGY